MAPSYLYAAPSGIIGDITRPDQSHVEPAMLVTPFPANYGVPMKYAQSGSGAGTGITPMTSSDAAAAFAGILARSAPGISQSSGNEAVQVFQPNQSEVQGLCTLGFIAVQVNIGGGTPVRGAPVYLVTTASTGHPLGSLEATSSANNIPLSSTAVGNVTFAADGMDATGIAEIRIGH